LVLNHIDPNEAITKFTLDYRFDGNPNFEGPIAVSESNFRCGIATDQRRKKSWLRSFSGQRVVYELSESVGLIRDFTIAL
jgi:hypothetical protein